MHVFPYSEREGTKAALMPDSVPRHIREERARELIALGRELEKKVLEARIGREEDVLVEEIDGQGNGAGYTGGYMRVCVRGGKPRRNRAGQNHGHGRRGTDGRNHRKRKRRDPHERLSFLQNCRGRNPEHEGL